MVAALSSIRTGYWNEQNGLFRSQMMPWTGREWTIMRGALALIGSPRKGNTCRYVQQCEDKPERGARVVGIARE